VSALEDDFTYVLRKALIGHALAPSDAAARAGLPEVAVLALLRGTFCASTARKLAAVLGLNAEALAGHPAYQPRPCAVPSIVRIDLPFGKEQVNCWLIQADDTIILFDAGFEPAELMAAVAANCSRLPDLAFITHAHHDHVGALSQLLAAGVPVHAAGIAGTLPMEPGATVQHGPLAVRACDLSGHATPALGFHVSGLAQPVLIAGDAIFAGSMGGCGTPALYRHARRRLHEVLDALPDATVVLPGHGPATTLGEERAANPFW